MTSFYSLTMVRLDVNIQNAEIVCEGGPSVYIFRDHGDLCNTPRIVIPKPYGFLLFVERLYLYDMGGFLGMIDSKALWYANTRELKS